jgi:hypothetical protein
MGIISVSIWWIWKLDAVNLVSWIAIMVGGLGLFVRLDWSPGTAVLSVPQFHESIFMAGVVWRVF